MSNRNPAPSAPLDLNHIKLSRGRYSAPACDILARYVALIRDMRNLSKRHAQSVQRGFMDLWRAVELDGGPLEGEFFDHDFTDPLDGLFRALSSNHGLPLVQTDKIENAR